MANFTVSIPKELKIEMNERSEIDWPNYFKKKFESRIKELKK